MSTVEIQRSLRQQERVEWLAKVATWPWITIALSTICGLLICWPAATELLQYDRQLIAAGEWWRVVTGHFVHWDWNHLFWDGIVFAALGVLCERRSRATLLVCLAVSAALISASVWFVRPDMILYRGLSGIDTALFALIAVSLLQEKVRERHWSWVAVIAVLLAGLGFKTMFELITGDTMFVQSQGTFVPVPLAHIAGGLAGAAVALRGNWAFPAAGRDAG